MSARGNPHIYSQTNDVTRLQFFVRLQFNTEQIIGWNLIWNPKNRQQKIAVTTITLAIQPVAFHVEQI